MPETVAIGVVAIVVAGAVVARHRRTGRAPPDGENRCNRRSAIETA
jgi:hypothetical protein